MKTLFAFALLLTSFSIRAQSEVPVSSVRQMPYYEDCKGDTSNLARLRCTNQKFAEHISKNFNLPKEAVNKGLEGTVYVSFVVSKNGDVTKVKIIKGVHPLLDEAAVSAVSKLPPLNPGYQLGKPVPVLYKVPVKINNDHKKRNRRSKKKKK